MPIITYECKDCGHQDERLVRKTEGAYQVVGGEPKFCPECGSSITKHDASIYDPCEVCDGPQYIPGSS